MKQSQSLLLIRSAIYFQTLTNANRRKDLAAATQLARTQLDPTNVVATRVTILMTAELLVLVRVK